MKKEEIETAEQTESTNSIDYVGTKNKFIYGGAYERVFKAVGIDLIK